MLTAANIAPFVPLFQTLLWIGVALWLARVFRPEITTLREVWHQRARSGAELVLGPLTLGRIDIIEKTIQQNAELIQQTGAQIQRAERRVEATELALSQIAAQQQAMEQEFLRLCEELEPLSPASDLDDFATSIKALASGLPSLAFLVPILRTTIDQRTAFGIACALQVRPQSEFGEPLLAILARIIEDRDLLGFRMKILYRLVMAVESILRLDNKRPERFLDVSFRDSVTKILAQLQAHQRVRADFAKAGGRSIVPRIERATALAKT